MVGITALEPTTLDFLVGTGESDVQDPCAPTAALPGASWIDSYFELASPVIQLELSGVTMEIRNATISGAFVPDSTSTSRTSMRPRSPGRSSRGRRTTSSPIRPVCPEPSEGASHSRCGDPWPVGDCSGHSSGSRTDVCIFHRTGHGDVRGRRASAPEVEAPGRTGAVRVSDVRIPVPGGDVPARPPRPFQRHVPSAPRPKPAANVLLRSSVVEKYRFQRGFAQNTGDASHRAVPPVRPRSTVNQQSV